MRTDDETDKLKLSGETRLSQVLEKIPGALDYIVGLNPHDFQRLHNPLLRKYMSPRISLRRIALMVKISEAQLLHDLLKLAGEEEAAEEVLNTISTEASMPKSPTEPPAWLNQTDLTKIHWVDVLPIDNVQGDPFPPISLAVKQMLPGTVIGIKHRWEPQPLYDIWQKLKLEWFARPLNPHEWHIFVYKPVGHLNHALVEVILVELKHLPQTELVPRVVGLFEQLETGQSLEISGAIPIYEQQIKLALEEKHFGKFYWQKLPTAAIRVQKV
jgi:uncharacterized protein (DUF2249 family)